MDELHRAFPAAGCDAGAACATPHPRLPFEPLLKGEERQRPLNSGRGRRRGRTRASGSGDAGAKRGRLQFELLESDQHADATENIVGGRHAEISSIIGVRRVAKKQDVRRPEGPTTKPDRQLLSGN